MRVRSTDGTRFPGFVDLQVNGFGGIDFAAPDLSRDQVVAAFTGILSTGTAAFLPTLVSAPFEIYRRNLPLISELAQERSFQGRVLGIHLEGPFLVDDPRVCGAHRAAHFLPASVETLKSLIDASQGMLRILTVSAELPSIVPVITYAKSAGILVSIGHSYFTVSDLEKAGRAGASMLTHFGNALPAKLPRHDNPLIAGLSQDELAAMVILDGHHLPRELFKILLRLFGPSRLLMTSDLSPAAGLPPGRYKIFDQAVTLTQEGAIWNASESHFAGAAKSLLDCANVALSWHCVTPADVFQMGVSGPLRALGMGLSDLLHGPAQIVYRSDANAFVSCFGEVGRCGA